MALINGFDDPRIVRRFGNLTTTATAEVLVASRTYNEPSSQAQRSVKSSSPNDDDPSGSGAKAVRIEYLDSSYVLKSEDVLLNGTTAVNTVATDIRFIQNFYVIKGAATAGAVELFPNTGGTGTAICGIGTGTDQAFFCHHYIPAGRTGWILDWGAVVDDDVALKLRTQARFDGVNLVDVNYDLEKLFDATLTPPTHIVFERAFRNAKVVEKTYVRVMAVPNQATSTVTRARLNILVEINPT